MWVVLLSLVIIAITLIPGLSKDIQTTIEGIGGAATQGPINTITSAWIEIALVAGGLGVLVWIGESKLAPKLGQAPPGAPGLGPILSAAPPSFGASSGLGLSAGPVQAHTGVTAASGGATPPPAPYSFGGGGGGGFGGGGGGRSERRLQSLRTQNATEREPEERRALRERQAERRRSPRGR